MDAFASVISNNLNIVMKFLTTVTIVMAIPNMIYSFFGMNVRGIPFSEANHGFFIVTACAFLIAAIAALIFRKKDLF